MSTELGPTRVIRFSDGRIDRVEGAPVSGYVTYGYGPREVIMTPAGPTSSFHNGVDIVNTFGTPVLSPAPARVAFSGMDSAGAHIVTVRFEDGTGAIFVHLDGPQVGYGKQVARGETLGFMGTTGLSTGTHLHYMRTRRVVDAQAFWYDDADIFDPFGPEGGHVESPAVVSPLTVLNMTVSPWPQAAGSGAYLAIIAAGTAEQLVAEARAEGVPLASVWVLIGGTWRGYVVGAPAAVNAGFPMLLPNTAVYVRRA